jgi:hypothetical protein
MCFVYIVSEVSVLSDLLHRYVLYVSVPQSVL